MAFWSRDESVDLPPPNTDYQIPIVWSGIQSYHRSDINYLFLAELFSLISGQIYKTLIFTCIHLLPWPNCQIRSNRWSYWFESWPLSIGSTRQGQTTGRFHSHVNEAPPDWATLTRGKDHWFDSVRGTVFSVISMGPNPKMKKFSEFGQISFVGEFIFGLSREIVGTTKNYLSFTFNDENWLFRSSSTCRLVNVSINIVSKFVSLL